VIVSESGIHTIKDVSKLNKSGIFTFLIGEHLIKSTNASEEIGEFINA
jgi:indole-3-glycerol phosphate synthase